MIRKLLLWIVVIIISLLSITGCTGKKIKLDYIKTPDTIVVQGYNNRDKIQALMDQITDMKKKGATREEQDKIQQEISNLTSKSTLEIKDKKVIESIIGNISSLEGSIEGSNIEIPKDKLLFLINCSYEGKSGNNPTEVNEGYLDHINILSDGTTFISRYDANDSTKITLIKTVLSKETIKYITDFYDSNI